MVPIVFMFILLGAIMWLAQSSAVVPFIYALFWDIIFVDNEKIFKDALSYRNYEDYFDDYIGGEFGHCTGKGNKLLAGNIVRVIFEKHFNK